MITPLLVNSTKVMGDQITHPMHVPVPDILIMAFLGLVVVPAAHSPYFSNKLLWQKAIFLKYIASTLWNNNYLWDTCKCKRLSVGVILSLMLGFLFRQSFKPYVIICNFSVVKCFTCSLAIKRSVLGETVPMASGGTQDRTEGTFLSIRTDPKWNW